MNNETTASQPKSIGDDAQFLLALDHYAEAVRDGGIQKRVVARRNLGQVIDNFRAPAAQASATIQAAPTVRPDQCSDEQRNAVYMALHYYMNVQTPDEWKATDEAIAAFLAAATIQEPVMVAEPVDGRPLFEREMLRLCIIDDEGLEQNIDGSYIDEPAQAAWSAWQARAALKAQPEAQCSREAVISECVEALTTYLGRSSRVDVVERNAIFGCREVVAALKAQPAPTAAVQGSFLVRVTPMNPEYADVHPELALEDALRVHPHGWPDGFQFEVVAAQGAQLSGNSGELAQGEDSARLDAERYRWMRVPANHFRLATSARWNTAAQLDAIIDRARASAETGWVKS